MSKNILVTWDFTDVSEYALEYAINLNTTQGTGIELVHVVDQGGGLFSSKSKIKESEVAQKLKEVAKDLQEKYKVQIIPTVLEGKLFDAVSDYSGETEASLVVMGTHGIKGMQKLTGSYALKVIAGSNVPFIVVQEQPKRERLFEHLVFPVDYRQETKEKLLWAKNIAKEYNSKIHMITPYSSDSGVVKKIKSNIIFAKKYFEQNGIEYQIHNTSKSTKFDSEIIKLSSDLEADMIIIMTTKNIDLSDYILGASEQYIIANEAKIPVLCINPNMV